MELIWRQVMLALGAVLAISTSSPLMAEERDEPAHQVIQSAGEQRTAERKRIVERISARTERFAKRQFVHDWDSGSLDLMVSKRRSGKKRALLRAVSPRWSRTYDGSIIVRQELASDITFHAGVALSRARYGTDRALILTQRSGGFSTRATLGFRSASGPGLSIEMFDRDGWSEENVSVTANRMINGERLAHEGFALVWSVMGDEGVATRRNSSSLSFRLEQGRTPERATATAAMMRVRTAF